MQRPQAMIPKPPIVQKTPARKQQKLRDSAKVCPKCMGCNAYNYDGQQLCLAHSNRLQDGKGRGIKATDESGAILCANCHDFVDGRIYSTMSRTVKQEFHRSAHEKTLAWWKAEGYLK